MSDVFLAWMAAAFCIVAGLERPDRVNFWAIGAWVAIACNITLFITGSAA